MGIFLLIDYRFGEFKRSFFLATRLRFFYFCNRNRVFCPCFRIVLIRKQIEKVKKVLKRIAGSKGMRIFAARKKRNVFLVIQNPVSALD